MISKTAQVVAILIVLGAAAPGAAADARRDAIIQGLLAEARKADPGFAGFSAARGEAFFRASHTGGKPDTPSCTSCHGQDPGAKGRTRAGKDIAPMTVSNNPARYTDPAEVAKWFLRNCKSVLGRECTAVEKGDFLAFVTSR
jgi:hypothetical protein